MSILVRPALPDDAAAIARIGRESFTWAFGHLYPQDVLDRYLANTYGVSKIAGSLAKPGNVYLVAEGEAGLQGFLKLKAGPGGVWQTQKLYVDPSAIQGGFGKRLMLAGLELMRGRGAVSTWLEVYTENERALRFYGGLGFVETGRTEHDFETVHVVFKRLERRF